MQTKDREVKIKRWKIGCVCVLMTAGQREEWHENRDTRYGSICVYVFGLGY